MYLDRQIKMIKEQFDHGLRHVPVCQHNLTLSETKMGRFNFMINMVRK